ncbi:MAG: hypothetical protein AAGK97_01935 [Bacteroidota bacterium]
MAEDFNDLIDQTETRAQALVIEADKAIELLDSVDAMVDNLSSTIEESANEAKESFDTLTEQITTAEDTLQTQQEAVKESMNGLVQQIQEAGGRIQESLTAAFNQFGELQVKKQESLKEVSDEISQVSGSFGELGNECNQVGENILLKAESINKNLNSFIDASAKEIEDLRREHVNLSDKLSDFSEKSSEADDRTKEQLLDVIVELNQKVENIETSSTELFDKTVKPEQYQFKNSLESVALVAEKSGSDILQVGKNIQEINTEVEDRVFEAFDNFSDLIESQTKTRDFLAQVEDSIA